VRRKALLAAAAVACLLTGWVVTASPVAADVECRYRTDPPALPEDQTVIVHEVGPLNPYWRTFALAQPQWSVLGVRPSAGTDYDMRVDECEGKTVAQSQLAGSAVDFVAVDGSRPWSAPLGQKKPMYVTVTRAGTLTGPFAIEYSTPGTPLAAGQQQYLVMRGPALVRDVTVESGKTAVLILRLLRGDADLALVDSTTTATTWARSRAQSIAQSVRQGLSEERITISVPSGVPARTFGIVVVNNAGYGEYLLSRF